VIIGKHGRVQKINKKAIQSSEKQGPRKVQSSVEVRSIRSNANLNYCNIIQIKFKET
jgi:hypothetical protein